MALRVFQFVRMYVCVPLPSGEGGAERRVRVKECVNLGPHPALRATFSDREKDMPSRLMLILDTSSHVYDRRFYVAREKQAGSHKPPLQTIRRNSAAIDRETLALRPDSP